ncbi:hypothetical protein ACIGXF_04375 [Streptomyces sp. NPDC053086]|uniref:hypothetical protein n=1 Tax=unclassified Streptomyces TaxID=2593676 RepID=UPI0037D115F8
MTAAAHRTPTAPAARPTHPGRAAALVGLACAALATVVRSGSFVTARGLHDSVPPVQHAFWRWVIALLALAPFGARRTWQQGHLFRRHARYVLLESFVALLSWAVLGEHTGWPQLLCLALVLAGVVLGAGARR